MCCLFSVLCQHHHHHRKWREQQQQQHQVTFHNHCSAVRKVSTMFYVASSSLVLILLNFVCVSNAQIAYTGYLSELRIQELHNMAIRLEHSIDMDKFACESYFDYVCGRNRPLFSILGK